MCFYIDGWFAVALTLLRSLTDALHVFNIIWNRHLFIGQYRRCPTTVDADVDGDDGAHNNNFDDGLSVQNFKGRIDFLFNILVVLPLPQVMVWLVIPDMLRNGETAKVMTWVLIISLLQYILKLYNGVSLCRRLLVQYIFGSPLWGIGLNCIAIALASHVVAAYWYLIGSQRSARCLMEQCMTTESCRFTALACEKIFIFGGTYDIKDTMRMTWASNDDARKTCLKVMNPDFDYGTFQWITYVICNKNRIEKVLFPNFWGLMMICTYGNLDQADDGLEIVFMIVVVSVGLLLITMLTGNIKVYIISATNKRHARKVDKLNMEWWMKKRNMPQGLRQRVRNYQYQQWATVRGIDERDMIRDLPEGLRRDIKYHLCLDLVRQVPLFQHMDSLVLENICDRVKSIVFPKGEFITKESDPVERMLFIVRGHIQCSQVVRNGVTSCCILGPGNFIGDELLSWCVRKPFILSLPPSSSALITLEATEALALEAEDVRYVLQHFRLNDKVKMTARYYSPGWRTWAAVSIQLAWLRCKHRLTLRSLSLFIPRSPLSRSASPEEDRLRLYTALLTSPKPHQDDNDSRFGIRKI